MTASARAALCFVLSVVLCGVVVHDVAEKFLFLSSPVALGLLSFSVVAVVAVVLVLRARRSTLVWLVLGVFAALSFRAIGYDRIRLRTSGAWASVREAEARRVAKRLQDRFQDLCQTARAQVRELASYPAVEETAESLGASGRGRLFDVLASRTLPRAHESGVPGVTVYDRAKHPLAWSGENVGLLPREVAVTSTTRVVERSTETLLVVTDSIRDELGMVALEIPLIADRRLGDPFLLDYDAFSSWAGRNVTARFAESSAERAGMSRAVREYGTFQFQQGLTGGPLWSAALGCDETTWLVTAEIEQEPIVASETRARESWAVPASVILTLSVLFALVSLWKERRQLGLPGLIAAIWAARIAIAHLDVPLGFGLDIDNPAHFASSLVYGLARSPVDFLLTMAAATASCALLAMRFARMPPHARRKLSLLGALPGSFLALAVLAGASAVLREIWLNSSLDLADIGIIRLFPPLVTMQVGLLLLATSASLLAYTAVSRFEVAYTTTSALLRVLLLDLALVLLGTLLLTRWGVGEVVLLAAPLLLLVHLAALLQSSYWGPLIAESGPYRRMSVLFLMLFAMVAAFYPALVRFEDRTVRSFVETTVVPSVLQYQDSRLYVIAETARGIDRAESEGAFVATDREELAYRLWVATELAVSAVSSAIEVLDETGTVVSRFSLNFPWIGAPESLPKAPAEWIIDERPVPGASEHPGFFMARRSFETIDGSGEIRFRVAFDWRNFPFVSTSNPYLHLFRTSGIETALRFPYQELELSVFRPDGTVVFNSTEGSLQLDEIDPHEARDERSWYTGLHEDLRHNTYVFEDETYRYAVSYPEKSLVTLGAELAGWVLLAAALGLCAVLAAILTGFLSPSELWMGLAGSFYGKLYVAFVLIALVPLVSLAFFLRTVVARQLERDAEQEGTARARVVGRLVADAVPEGSIGGSMLTDGLLESVGAMTAVDVDIYFRGDLVATSKPELFASGLLRPRVQAGTYRDLVVERLSHTLHRQAIGTFEYVVASVPLTLDRSREPAILSVPLASRQPEILRRVETFNQAVLLAALGFALGAFWVARALARLIAGPVAELTEATHHVAEGELDVELHTESSDEIGRLFRSFMQMTADLKRQRDDLERTKKLEAWAEMARQVAHEIKNPLTPIQLSAEHLRRVFHDPNVDFEEVLEDCSSTILEQVKTLRQISMEFSTFASPEPLLREPTDLAELVRGIVAPYAKTPPERIAFELECADGLPLIAVDRRLMKRTLVNLIENAIHALGQQGRVSVVVEAAEGDSLAITVADDGPGVDPDIKARVFEPYFSTRAAGTGLGLAIAKKVVEDHGGTIALTSEPGEGTKVTILLPTQEPTGRVNE